ncbi:hypothetical protein BWQ96_07534 [Gracilariopsis chorda]|uniref:Serine-threonine/tyrosine-protein kinase catalytic domain-containing protein n=1 Tax=Gracilariopsis chorda TaxID=448386 RepID=A0A2V3IKZ5_9FLOR|nr:hypothetical protein BWQ96_07534 [Gracilariopsis chorda]|eukprot:PXF42719.1 hypothetical protein BWQ96_07534 [Gracilariopsis chorda]
MLFALVDNKCQLEFVFDYYGIRYHIFLQQNNLFNHCKENTLLNKVWEDVQNGSNYDESIWECLNAFWPFVAEDSDKQGRKEITDIGMSDRFAHKNTIKIQLVTGNNSALSPQSHNQRCLYPFLDPLTNPFPHSVRVFAMEEIEFLKEIWDNVFKAKIGSDLVCVKAAPADDLRSELESLMRAPHHPSIIHPLLGVVDAGGGRIDKIVMPFIEGNRLSVMKNISTAQKQKWKSQLADAVEALHQNGMTWGDVHHRNVMIDGKSKIVVLIDLADSHLNGTTELVPELFASAKMQDLLQLELLKEFIDGR